MVSITDIGDLSREVTVRNRELVVRGVSVNAVILLLDRFPDLKKLITGKAQEVDAAGFLMSTPALAAGIIAHGLGEPTPAAEAAVLELSAGEQMDLLEAVVELTFPKGVVSFAQSLQRVVAGAGGSGRAPATNSRALSSD